MTFIYMKNPKERTKYYKEVDNFARLYDNMVNIKIDCIFTHYQQSNNEIGECHL